ncbi:MAG TPA: TonB family protein [Dongiaceae bacterium]|nr:TonB family protein [Dongiaceae bacterium]
MTAASALGWRHAAIPSPAGPQDTGLRDGRPGAVLWSASVLFVLACHALIAWSLLATNDLRPDLQQPLPAIMMDLAPLATPQPAPPQARSAPPQAQPVPLPDYRPVPHPPAPQPKLTAPELPPVPAEAALPPPPKKQIKPQLPAKPQSAKPQPAKALPPKPDTTPAPQPASRTLPASAPAVLAPTQNAAQQQQAQANAAAAVAAKSNWLGDVVQHIAKFKRVPRARLRLSLRAVIGFEINRDGKLLSQHLLQSSGRDDIDEEALAWIRRADPLPKPPREISDGDLSHGFTIPVDFTPR